MTDPELKDRDPIIFRKLVHYMYTYTVLINRRNADHVVPIQNAIQGFNNAISRVWLIVILILMYNC